MTANDVNANATALYQHIHALVSAAKDAANLPKCEDDVAAMLDKLAEAELASKAHFIKFDRKVDPDVYENNPACKADWSKVCDMRDRAIGALTRFAMARHEAASTQKAA